MCKIGAVFAIAILSLAFISCDIFLYPVRGRWNHLDPETDLVHETRYLYPVEDGHVWEEDPPDPSRYEGGSESLELHGEPPFPFSWILLRFDFTEFPFFAEDANLELYCSSVTTAGSADIRVFRIMEPWSSGTVNVDKLMEPGFIDQDMPEDPVRFISDTNIGQYIPWDSPPMTQLVRHTIEDGIHHGFMLEPLDIWLGFHSIEKSGMSAYPPRLEVTGWFLDE